MEQTNRFIKRVLKLAKRDWPAFGIMGLLFLAGIWMGDRVSQLNPQLAELMNERSLDKFTAMAKWLKDLPFFVWIFAIFLNNLIAVIMAFFSGVLIFPPALIVLANGAIVSLAQKHMEAKGLDRASFYLSLVPHGIFELSAVFIAAGLGIRFGLVLLRSLWSFLSGRENNGMLKSFIMETEYYSILIVVLLSIAAVVEVTVSPLLLYK